MSEVSIPLDSQGFLRRECPQCERHFKWHHGPVEPVPEDAPDPVEYFCPYCGESAPPDQWWTRDQVEFIQTTALRETLPEVEAELRRSLEPLGRTGILRAEVRSDAVNPPPPLFESDDMQGVASPCHSYEPIKILEDWSAPIHCLVCGKPFIV